MPGKKVPTPRHRVLSGRVSEDEYEEFQKQADAANRTVSDIVRTVMTDWLRSGGGKWPTNSSSSAVSRPATRR